MATPIKTEILNEVKLNIIAVIGEASRVFIDPSRGLREETTERYTNIFSNAEQSRKKDLYSEKTFEMEIHTWVKKDTDDLAREEAILTNAEIQEQILPRNSSVRKWCQYLEEAESNCADIVYYAEGLCVAISRYVVKYYHVYGKPSQQIP